MTQVMHCGLHVARLQRVLNSWAAVPLHTSYESLHFIQMSTEWYEVVFGLHVALEPLFEKAGNGVGVSSMDGSI